MIKTLSELCAPGRSICYGVVQPGQPTAGGKPILRVKDLSGDRIDFSDVMHVEEKIEAKYKRSRIKSGDVLISLVGSLGQVAIAGPEVDGWNIARAVGLVPVPDRHHAEWVRYSIQSEEAQSFIREHANTTVQATFNLKDLARLPIPYPPEKTRSEILEILGALDNKIDLNRQMAATLEEMARALYRSWFVDFDPVKAKAEGLAPAFMDEATAALFPDRFGDNGLPEWWEMASIYEVSKVQYGAPFKSNLFNTEGKGRPLVRIRDLKNHQAGVYTTEVHPKEYLIQPGDTVVGMDGDFTPYTWCAEPSLMNQRVCCFIPLNGRDHAFVRLAIPTLLKAEEEAAVATTVIHLGKKDIDTFKVVIPPDPVLNAFGERVNPILSKLVAAGIETKNLADLRDTLLPKLMSGELRVGEARDQIEEVA